MRFDGDVDAFRSMTVKVREIKTWNNSTSMFNDSMCGLLIYVSLQFEYYICLWMLDVRHVPGNFLLAICSAPNICIFTGKIFKFLEISRCWRYTCTVALKLQHCWWINFSHICRSLLSVLVFALSADFISLNFVCTHSLLRSETWDWSEREYFFGKLKNYFELEISLGLFENT